MKFSIAYAAAVCTPAVMAAALNPAAAMSTIQAQASSAKSLISKHCPKLQSDCSSDLNNLLSDLQSGASAMDTSKIQSGASSFTNHIKSNPVCVQPIADCIQSVKSAVATSIGTSLPAATGGVIKRGHSSNSTTTATDSVAKRAMPSSNSTAPVPAPASASASATGSMAKRAMSSSNSTAPAPASASASAAVSMAKRAGSSNATVAADAMSKRDATSTGSSISVTAINSTSSM